MSREESMSPSDDYFNDLAQHAPAGDISPSGEPGDRSNGAAGPSGNSDQPKAKRIACILCRKRKLRCDGARPMCGTCKRLSHDCAYDEVRKKSGPKRGYVKLLEARLQQVETLLKTQDPPEVNKPSTAQAQPSFAAPNFSQAANGAPANGAQFSHAEASSIHRGAVGSASGDSFSVVMDTSPSQEPSSFSWEVIGLGLEEPLPTAGVIEDLHRLYFQKIHPSIPMIHRPRYLTAMTLMPNLQPPVCLRYIVWCLASSASEKYSSLTEIFYYRARKYAHMDEMKGHGELVISLATCQAWLLIALYEFKNMYFPRAWLSVGRATRSAQMMMLHRLDGSGLDVKQCLPPPKDWIEREERRRTFWTAFCEDRYASIGTGWPMTIDERDIMTNLPASEEAYEMSRPEPTTSLDQALKPGGTPKISVYSGVVVMGALFGRNLHHLHRPGPDDDESNLDGAFWRRHRMLEGILSHTALSLPDHLRLPGGLPDPNVIFMNMAIHTSAICLHQAAIFKADRHRLPPNVSSESRVRCVTAAAETARIMRMISHLDLITMNPFMAFCLYVAARVFVQYLKFRPNDQQMMSSLRFLLEAMQALKRKNALTESFLVQLEVDLEGAGIDVGQSNFQYSKNALAELPLNFDSVKCSPLFELRESQNPSAEMNRFQILSEGSDPANVVRSKPASATDSPGPPFHTATANINLELDSTSFSYMADQHSTFRLPHHAKSPANGAVSWPQMASSMPFTESLTPPSDLDGSSITGVEQGSASRNNSSPHNAFAPLSQVTPPSQDGDASSNRGVLFSATDSTKTPLKVGGKAVTSPTNKFGDASANGSMLSTGIAMDPAFTQFQSGNFMGFEEPDPSNLFAGNVGGSIWDMSGLEASDSTGMINGTGGEMNWTQVLDGMTGWNGVSEELDPGLSSTFNINQQHERRAV